MNIFFRNFIRVIIYSCIRIKYNAVKCFYLFLRQILSNLGISKVGIFGFDFFSRGFKPFNQECIYVCVIRFFHPLVSMIK